MKITGADYAYLQELIHREAGICLPPDKEYLVAARLAPLIAQSGLSGFGHLMAELRAGSPGLGLQVATAMTIKETSWMRDGRPFEALRREVIPEILARTTRPRFWSAATATGQEAYSLAMLLADYFPHVPAPAILATDLAGDALDRAASGTYTQLEVNRGLPAGLLLRHFRRAGLHWRIRPEVAKWVTFSQLNLVRAWPVMEPVDVVLLRNVLIYFDIPTRRRIIELVADLLRPGGYLLLGGAETLIGVSDRFTGVQVGGAQFYCQVRARR